MDFELKVPKSILRLFSYETLPQKNTTSNTKC